MKVAVVGTGGSGSAAMRFLAKAGHEVTGYEQFGLGHAQGSSHGHSRIIRRAYPDDFHTGMMRQAYRLWDDLEAEHGERLFTRCGGITFAPEGDPTLEATREALFDAGLAHDIMDREETASRFPAIDIGEGSIAIFQKDSGYLRATRCVLAQAAIATSHGASLHEHTPVLSLEEGQGRILITTASGTRLHDAAIITAGAWAGKLLSPLNLPLRTALRQVVYARIARNEENFLPGKLPVWIEHPSDFYGFPCDGEIPGVKIASHDAGMDHDPGNPERPVMTAALEQVLEHASRRFPDLLPESTFAQSCLYTITPDERFILDFSPGSRRVVVCSGCSGHGFKFTILLGKIAAEMATSGKRDASPPAWRIDRFC